MVWALVMPNGFGDYFPNGDYVGWDERTARYFEEEMTAEQRAVYENRIVRYQSRISDKFTLERAPLEPHEWPVEFRTVKTPKALASLIQLNDGLLAVDETLKAIIETLEPGVHQFQPIRITLPKDKDYPIPYYGIVIRQFRESFVPEQSENYRKSEEDDFYSAKYISINHCAGLVFSRDRIGGAHLWRERKLLNPEICISDTLQAEIARRGLRIFKAYKVQVV